MSEEEEEEEVRTTTVEQWRWSEMQGLELLSSNPNPNPNPNLTTNPPAVGAQDMDPSITAPAATTTTSSSSTSLSTLSSVAVKDGAGKDDGLPPVRFGELFRFADGLDYVLMGIGSVGALVHGCSLPLFLRFFADLVNSFGSNANNMDRMTQEVIKYAFYFPVVGAAIWASSWAEISCWMWTGERQTTKMRIKYLEAALNQDIQFFDTQVRTSDAVLAINTDAVMIQDVISEKLGNFIHYTEIFVSGFVVGFKADWQLALVTLVVVALIAIIGGIHTATLAKLSTKLQDAFSQAGIAVEQVLIQSISI